MSEDQKITAQEPTKNLHILVVEDEEPLAKAVKNKLTHEGFPVDCVRNGKDAIEKVDSNTYDVMLLDILMPEVDGFEVLRHIKEKNITIPTIMVTSNLSQVEDLEKAKELGATKFFVKSDTPLSDIVNFILELDEK